MAAGVTSAPLLRYMNAPLRMDLHERAVMESREMYDEINALVGAVAKALDVGEMEVVTAIEQGRLGMEMLTDEDGRNFLQVAFDGRNVRIYQGAIFREGDRPNGLIKPDPVPAATDDGGCGGGCTCGH